MCTDPRDGNNAFSFKRLDNRLFKDAGDKAAGINIRQVAEWLNNEKRATVVDSD